jgi:very-short-patch-repair endonuclease
MSKAVDRARQLRKSKTLAEQLAWDLLRDGRLQGLKFRRQHPIGNCIVDFYCASIRLIVELDGSVHSQPSQELKDKSKDFHLRRLDYQVLRVPNGLVLQDPEAFLKKIRKFIGASSPTNPSPRPSPRFAGRGGS